MSKNVEVSYDQFNACENGADCVFIAIGGRGLKCYRNACERDTHYNHQKRLSALGLAPYVDDCVDVTFANGCNNYGYWSGLADVAVHHYATTYSNPKRKSDRADLKGRLGDAGYEWKDDHDGNWGYINGRAVLVDCAGY